MKKILSQKVIMSSAILLAFCLSIFVTQCSDADQRQLVKPNKDWSKKMAQSAMFQMGAFDLEGEGQFQFTFLEEFEKWNYQLGVYLKSLLDLWHQTGDQVYFNYVKQSMDKFVQDDGTILTYEIEKYSLDEINTGKILLELYDVTKEERYLTAVETLVEQLKDHPRTDAGGFWHKKQYYHQMWLDGVYMWTPFYARYVSMLGSESNYNDIIFQIEFLYNKTKDPETGLLYHAWDESRKERWSNPETGLSPEFWGRAIGWYMMALVDVLDYLPADYSGRETVISILNELSQSLLNYQDEESGVWFQVVDQGTRQGNYLEASSSSMYVYTMLKGIRNGYLPDEWIPSLEKAYQGLIDQFVVVDGGGLAQLTRICGGAGLGRDPYRSATYKYYVTEDIITNDLKGLGPFIMASLEIEKIRD